MIFDSQDWLTLLGWERPELFHLLPCTFNVQTHEVREDLLRKVAELDVERSLSKYAAILLRATRYQNGPQFGISTKTAQRNQR